MAPCFLAGNIPRRHLVVFFLAAGELGLAAATPPYACVWPPTVLVFFGLPGLLQWRGGSSASATVVAARAAGWEVGKVGSTRGAHQHPSDEREQAKARRAKAMERERPGSETNIPTSIPHPRMLWKRGGVRDRMLIH